MQRKQERPGGRSARVRAAVLSAFLDALVESGYSQVSFETLASRAGVHKTTLYRRWGTRENLLLDAALHSAAEAVPVPDTGVLHTDLHELVAAIAANLRSPPAEAMLRAVVSEAMARPTVANAARRFWQARFAGAREIVARAIDRGEVAPTVDPDLVIEMLIGPVYLRVLVTQEPVDDEFIRSLVGFVVRGTA
ncbi:MAG TPA: TetR/AcrR family transcriptional regulator [Egibacteraceae bacterium]|nr:TetR/AcrR family transcriptional regulator [Egibacteraceae bacterium]